MRTHDPAQQSLPGIDSSPVTFLSPSTLDKYLHCPRLYRFLYVDGMWNRSRVTATQSFGTTIHAVMREFFRLPVARRSAERLLGLLRDWYQRADVRAVPYATEVDLQASWGDVVLKGRLDRVDTDRDGGLVVVDYKTGRRPVSQEAADADSALTIYAALAQRRLHRPVHGLVLDYVVAGTQVRTERPPEVLDERLDQVLETASRLRADREFTPRTGPWCSSCDLLGACPDGQREISAG